MYFYYQPTNLNNTTKKKIKKNTSPQNMKIQTKMYFLGEGGSWNLMYQTGAIWKRPHCFISLNFIALFKFSNAPCKCHYSFKNKKVQRIHLSITACSCVALPSFALSCTRIANQRNAQMSSYWLTTITKINTPDSQ